MRDQRIDKLADVLVNYSVRCQKGEKVLIEGRGIDGVLMPVHKTLQFLGLRPLESFMANDVLTNPQIEADLERWKAHLTALFG